MARGHASLYNTEGIVLRKWRMGERDIVLALFSPSEGRLDLAARGSRKAGSSVGTRLEPFMRVRALVARGRTLDTLSQAEIVDARRSLGTDLARLASGTYVLELYYRMVEPGATPAVARLFASLVRSLDELEASGPVDSETVVRRAELRLLTVLGIAPRFDECVTCEGSAPPTHLSVAAGGVLCAACRHQAEGARPLSEEAWHLLRLLRSPQLAALAPARDAFDLRAFREVEGHMTAWMEWHCPVPLRSRRFLAQVGRTPTP